MDIWNEVGKRIYTHEVGTQAEEAFVPTAEKVALVNALSQAGLAATSAFGQGAEAGDPTRPAGRCIQD